MRIAIVEDESSERSWLLECLGRYEREHGLQFEIRQFEDGDAVLTPYRADYDLILMDIEMGLLDGMAAAREIRKTDEEVQILFITRISQYVMNGYEVGALDYLLKPVTYFALEKRLDRVVRLLGRKKQHFVRLHVKGGFCRVDRSQIRYVETEGQGLIYHTEEGDYRTWESLQEAEKLLKGGPFFRCNKCYLVNLSYIDSLIGYELRLGEDVLLVSRAKKKPLLDAINQFLSERMP